MGLTIIVATFGSEDWHQRGLATAANASSAHGQPFLHYHGRTLAEARNAGAARADTEWLCFLDADDSLEPHYFSALLAGGRGHVEPLLAPRVRYDDGKARSLQSRDMAVMNPCVIGTLVTRKRFFEAGGFWEEPAYEDWSLFRRCWMLGSRVIHVPGAVYRANGTKAGSGRNLVTEPLKLRDDIIASHDAWKEAGCPSLCS